MIVAPVEYPARMPRNCSDCYFYDSPQWCKLTGRTILGRIIVDIKEAMDEVESMPHRPDWCELFEVVRCKDCKYYDHDGWCNSLMIDVNGPDWFCASGEAKD